MSHQTTNLQQGLDIDWQRRFTEIFQPPNNSSGGLWEKIKRSSTPEANFEYIDEPILANKWFNFQAKVTQNNRNSIDDSHRQERHDDDNCAEAVDEQQLFEAVDPEDSRYFFWFNGGKHDSKEKLPEWMLEGSNHSRRMVKLNDSAISLIKETADENSRGSWPKYNEGSNLTFSYFIDKESSRESSPVHRDKQRSLPAHIYTRSKRKIMDFEDTRTKENSEDNLLFKREESSATKKPMIGNKHISH